MASRPAEPRKRRYQQVLRTTEHNTGGPDAPQAATITPSQVALHLAAHGPHTATGVKESIQAAREQGDLVALDVAGEQRLARGTEAGLKAVVAEQNCRADPDVDVIEQAVAALKGVDDVQ